MVLAISSVLLILAGIGLFFLQAWSLRQNYVRQIEASADLTSRNLAASINARDLTSARQTLGSLRLLPEIIDCSFSRMSPNEPDWRMNYDRHRRWKASGVSQRVSRMISTIS
jgi:hypothetical protein